jgi:hypothetical protein
VLWVFAQHGVFEFWDGAIRNASALGDGDSVQTKECTKDILGFSRTWLHVADLFLRRWWQ